MQSNLSVRSGRPKQAPGAVVRAPIKTRRGAVIITRKSLFGKQKSVNLRTLRRVCAGFVALAAACGASLAAFAEPVEPADQAAILRTVRAPGNLSAIAEGPERVALSWQAPMASDRSELTGYGIQFSDDGGANWSVLPTLGRRTTSFVHTVGLRASATLLYRVFAIGADGAGPAAVATAVLPRTSVPRITAVQLTANQGTVRWYPPRQEVAVTVQFDQTVTVNMTYGTPQIDLEMGRPPHRQSGYASDYSGGSGTDRLTFRYVTGDWNQDLSDIEVAPNALDLNGGRIVNLHATHRASLAHGPASLEVAPQVDARSDAVLVLDTRAPARVPAAPKADLQIARNEQSGSPALATMLSAAGALVAGTEIVQQLALAEEREVAEFATLEQVSGGQGSDILESVETVAVDLGQGVGPRAAAIPESEIPGAPFLFISEHGQAQLDLSWNLTERDKDEKYNIDVMDYLIEVSEDGASWTNLIGYDTQNNDLYLPLATQPASTTYSHVGLEPGTTHHYRVKARTSNGVEGPWSTGRRDIRDSYATTRPIRPVPECAAAFWSTEITVGSKTQFNQDGYWTNLYGSIADDDFSLGGTDYFVYNAWVADPSQSNPHYHFGVSPAFSDAEREDLTLYVGPVALPLGNTTTRTQQTGYYAYLWTSTDYAETFGYPPVSGASHPYDRFAEYALGDKVTVCLVDATPRVTLTLDPASISENAETSTITASVSSASDTAFTVTVSAEPDDPAVDADFTLSTKVLSFAANATESTGAVTITTVDNDVDAPNKTIQVKGELPGGVPVRAPADVTLTITDDDAAPQLSLSVSPATISEDGGEATITVSTVDSTFVEEQTITLTLEGSATKGTDYTAAAQTLNLGSGERSVTTLVTAIDDSTDESDETILVTAMHDGRTVGIQQQITIADTLAAAVSANSSNVDEGDAAEFTVTLSGGTSTAAVEVDYLVDSDSTATAGDDYAAPTGKLTITAGESGGTITIGTETDEVHDPGETVVLKLASASTDTRTVNVDGTAKVMTTITDTGRVEVSVGPVLVEDDDQTPEDETDDKSTVEEGETASFVVTLSGEVSGTVSVTYTTANGTAESGTGKDYTTASGTLEFTTGQTSKTIDVTTLEDSLNEASETYTLTLTGVSGVTGVSLGTASATGTIEDDDVLTAALDTHTENVPEGSEATFEVDLSGGTSTAAVEVTYEVDASSTATSGTDYTAPTSWKLTIAAGVSSGTITIGTLDNDGVLDPGETLVVKLASATTDTRTVTVDATATKTATILEQDTETVSVGPVLVEDDDQTPEDETDDKSTVEEGETASFVVTLSGEVSGTVSVTYTTANGTAESGTGKDYTAASGTLEFTTGQTSKTIDVTTLEDSLNEASETYTLTLTGVSGVTGVSLEKASATGTIEDDDVLTAALDTHTANVAEGDDATFEVDLSGGTSTSAVEVTYEVDASSTATSGTDYTAPTSWKLTIAAGESSGTITIGTLDNDGVLDPGETLVVKLASATTDTRTVTVDATATKTTTIGEQGMETVSVGAVTEEDDPLTEDVDETDDKSTVEEGETASFVVTLSGEVSGTVSVTYTTANGTAESGTGKDYTTASGTLEFTTGQTSKTIDVTTLEDSLNEASETYTLTLTGVSGVTGVSLGKASETGTIEDDDVLTAALDTHTENVPEGSEATFEVDLSGGTSTADVEVTYEVDASSTATSGTDYTAPTSWKLTIAAGESSGTIAIATLDNDGVLDPGETLVVKLASATTDTRTVTVDATATKTATILEQDTETVSVGPVLVEDDDQTPEDETDDKSTVEEGETASFVVTLSGEVSGTVSVTYTTANGTAESGTGKDYTAASGTLEFTTGQTSKTIDVTTLEDGLNEASETYTLTLTGVSGVTGVSLEKASETGTIEDDDVLTAALDTHTANVAEGDDATFEVDLSGGTSTAAVEVTYEVDASSTATSGTDYTAPTSWKLTIAAGEQRNDHDSDAGQRRGAGPRRDAGGEAGLRDDGHADGDGGRHGDEDGDDPGTGHGNGVGRSGAGGRR